MYNYVFLGSNQDLYKVCYKDIIEKDNVIYIPSPYYKKCFFVKLLYRFHWSERVNRIIKLPFKNIWNPYYFTEKFENKNPICFVFFHNWCEYEKYGLIINLRKNHPKSKIVCFFQDLILLQKGLDINHIKNVFDLVISYDYQEAERYNIAYHPTVYSKSLVKHNRKIYKTDVYFLGASKNRFQKIVMIYEYLKNAGLKCDFYVTNVNPKDQLKYPGINYITKMSYEENLQHIVNAQCILEIVQENSVGYTIRTWEAIMYDKKLLTDNLELLKAPFFNPINIFVINNIYDLSGNQSFFKNFSRKTNHHYKNNISPASLLDFIAKKLSEFNDI